ncbi:MAG TPA: IPT/TIG domain-containing protein [Longimicrobium sp.]
MPANPESASPNMGYPADSYTVAITGTGLADVTACSFGPGITVLDTRIVNDGKIMVNIQIASDAPNRSNTVTVIDQGGGAVVPGGFDILQPQ